MKYSQEESYEINKEKKIRNYYAIKQQLMSAFISCGIQEKIIREKKCGREN